MQALFFIKYKKQELVAEIKIRKYLLCPQCNYTAVQPPSTINVVPVISEAAGDARNSTAFATSFGSPILPSMIFESTCFLVSSLARYSSVPGVKIKVGAIAFTVILYFAHSTAKHFVRCAMPALVIQYTD